MKAPKNYIGIDVGGTKIAGQKYEYENGKFLPLGDLVIVKTDPQRMTESIIECVLKTKDEFSVALGIGWPGDVDRQTGLIHSGVNVGNTGVESGGFNLIDPIKKTGIPKVRVLNDADAQILSVTVSNENIKNAVVLCIGTGFGVGVLIDEKILWSSEYGHHSPSLIEKPNGSMEDIISGTGLTKMLHDAGFSGELSVMMKNHKTETLFIQTLSKWKQYFAAVISNIQLTYRPETVFISGGCGRKLNEEDDNFLNNLEKNAKQILMDKHFPRIANDLKVEKIPFEDARTRGAALYARR